MVVRKSDLIWTSHAKEKRKYYQLSEARVVKALKNPDRTERGIAPETIASMKKAETKKDWEIWVMWKQVGNNKKIISVWRYPGSSPKGELPLPDNLPEDLS